MSEQERFDREKNTPDVEAHRAGTNRAGTGRAGTGRADEPTDEALTESAEDEVEAHVNRPRGGI